LRVVLAVGLIAGAMSAGVAPAQAEETGPAGSGGLVGGAAGVATSTTLELDRTSALLDGKPLEASVRVSVPGATGAAVVAAGAAVLTIDGEQQPSVPLDEDGGPVTVSVPVGAAGEHVVSARFVPAPDSEQEASTSETRTYTAAKADAESPASDPENPTECPTTPPTKVDYEPAGDEPAGDEISADQDTEGDEDAGTRSHCGR
jgi:hypothetical protein